MKYLGKLNKDYIIIILYAQFYFIMHLVVNVFLHNYDNNSAQLINQLRLDICALNAVKWRDVYVRMSYHDKLIKSRC